MYGRSEGISSKNGRLHDRVNWDKMLLFTKFVPDRQEGRPLKERFVTTQPNRIVTKTYRVLSN